MLKENDLKVAYKWLNDTKVSKRLSYKDLGHIIGYSDVGFSKALRNQTLSIAQIKIIKEKLDGHTNFPNQKE